MEIGIAEMGGAVSESQFGGFSDQVQRVGGVLSEPAQIEPLKQIQNLHEMDAAGRRRRHRDNLASAIDAARHRALKRLVGGHILQAHSSASAIGGGDYFLRHGAFIKAARSLARDDLQRIRQIALHETLAAPQRRTVSVQENIAAGFVAAKAACGIGKRIRQITIHLKAGTRQSCGGRNQLCELEASRAVALQSQREACDSARHSHAKAARL